MEDDVPFSVEETGYNNKHEVEYEHKKKLIKESTENLRSMVEDLLTVIPDCNNRLLAIAEDLDTFHQKATNARTAGISVAIVGGITSLALVPFTLGGSTIGICLATAVAGGVTGAAASIADSVNIKINCGKAEDIVKTVNTKMKTYEMASKELDSLIKDLEAMEKTGEIPDEPTFRGTVALARSEADGIVQLSELSLVAARGVQVALQGNELTTVIIAVIAALVIGAVLHVNESNNYTKTKEATEIRKHVEELKKLHQDLKKIAKDLFP
ncbi:apolipoprotein L6-like [Eleutherodactylus coqui]|uniref:apolipoprotein L6-like n=1 Tax=Eleutherodactylus coqui TaxID=57060 RepID=UPI003463038D